MNKIVSTARPHAYFLFLVAIMASISAMAFGTAELIEHQQSYYTPAVQTIKEVGYMTTAGIIILTIIYTAQLWTDKPGRRHRQRPATTTKQTEKEHHMTHRVQRKLLWQPAEELSTDEVVATLIPIMEQEKLIGAAADTNQKEDVLDLMTGNCDQEWDQAIFHATALSEQWTDFTFIMDCLDEDGQLWREFYRNGKAYREYYHPPEFDQDHYQEFAKPPTD